MIELNRRAMRQLPGNARLDIIRHIALFEEPGALEQVARLAREWLSQHLRPVPRPTATKGATRMADTGFSSFSTTVDKTNRVLKSIEQRHGWTKERRNQSYGALRAVLHALRDRLTVEETAHLAAQLPVLIRGVYYTGWDPSRVPVKMHRDEFLARVRREIPYEVQGGIEPLVDTVLESLRLHITDGEWREVKSILPKDLATVLP